MQVLSDWVGSWRHAVANIDEAETMRSSGNEEVTNDQVCHVVPLSPIVNCNISAMIACVNHKFKFILSLHPKAIGGTVDGHGHDGPLAGRHNRSLVDTPPTKARRWNCPPGHAWEAVEHAIGDRERHLPFWLTLYLALPHPPAPAVHIGRIQANRLPQIGYAVYG